MCVCVPLFLRGLRGFCLFLGVGRHPSCMIKREIPELIDGVPDEDNQLSERRSDLLGAETPLFTFQLLGVRLRSFDVFHQVCAGTASEPRSVS